MAGKSLKISIWLVNERLCIFEQSYGFIYKLN